MASITGTSVLHHWGSIVETAPLGRATCDASLAAFGQYPATLACVSGQGIVRLDLRPWGLKSCTVWSQEVDTGNHSWANYFLAAYKVRQVMLRIGRHRLTYPVTDLYLRANTLARKTSNIPPRARQVQCDAHRAFSSSSRQRAARSRRWDCRSWCTASCRKVSCNTRV